VLSGEEVSRLINAAGTLFRRTLLMTLYGIGMRRAEFTHLKVSDFDRQRMIIRVEGGKDHDLPPSPAPLAANTDVEQLRGDLISSVRYLRMSWRLP
jgi:integrase